MAAGTRRQYFRLVAGPVSVWYSEHSDANPDTRYKPEAEIIHGNKFGQPCSKDTPASSASSAAAANADSVMPASVP